MNADPLVDALRAAIEEIEREAIDLVEVDHDGRGRSKPIIAGRDREYFSVLTEEAQSLRGLVEVIKARQRDTP